MNALRNPLRNLAKRSGFFVLPPILVLFGGYDSHAQPAVREFYQKSASTYFNAQALLEARGRRAAEEIIDYLGGSLGGGGASFAYMALQQLALTGHPKAVAVLERYLGEEDLVGPQWQAVARKAVIDGLAALGTPAARKALAAALRVSANKMYFSEIVKHCGRLRAAECGPAVVEYIQRDEKYYDDSVINLAQCHPAGAVSLIGEQLKTRQRAVLYDYEVLALGVAGQAAASLLIQQAKSYPVRHWSGEWAVNLAWALGRVPDREAMEILRSLVKAEEPLVVYFAALSLAAHRDRTSLPLLQRAAGLRLKRDFEYADDGSDSDWGFFRRERIRQAEFDLALAFVRAFLGEAGEKGRVMEASRSPDQGLAMLADSFLLQLGDKEAGQRLVAKIEQEARKGFPNTGTDPTWNQSLEDAMRALVDWMTPEGARAAMRICSVGHWYQKDLGDRLLSIIPEPLRIRILVQSLGSGKYLERNQVKETLRLHGEAMLPELERALSGFDLDGRVLATSLLGEFDDPAGAKVLKKLSLSDPAWQVRRMARASLAVREGRAWPPKVKLQGSPKGFVAYGEAEKIPKDPVGACELGGKVFLAGKEELASYDGYQWRSLKPSGLCEGPITALFAFKGRLYAFSQNGMAVGDGVRFSCKSWKQPPVHLALVDRNQVLLGTEKGLFGFDGDQARRVAGSPERRVKAIARQGEAIWVGFELAQLTPGVRYQPALSKSVVPESLPPSLYRLEEGRWTPEEEPLLSYEGFRIPMELFALAVHPDGKLFVGCTEGVLAFDGRRWELVDDQQGYDPRYPVDAIHVSQEGVVTALQGPWLDQRDEQGRWHRSLLGAQTMENVLLMAGRKSTAMLRSNGDGWLVLGDFVQVTYKMMPGMAVRLVGPKPPERKLPPETLFVMAKAGEWRWESPETVVEPPNIAREAGGRKPVEIPAAQASIEAAAQDPWDYEEVSFQFKLDEEPWGAWQKENGMLTPLLGEGEHLLRVRARDASGNLDPTPAVLHFTVHTREVAVVRILDGKFKSVFPSQYKRYEREGVGQVQVENRATEPLNLKLNLKVRDLFDTPATRSITVPAGGKAWVSLTAPFNHRVLALTGGAEVQAVVEVDFEFEGIQRQVRRSFPLNIASANAFDWSEPGRLVGFINSADPLVERLGAEVFRAFSRSPGATVLPMRNLALAAYLFRSLGAFGVRYKPDPTSPFSGVKPGSATVDTVRYPGQTLLQKVGDCDDLVVLYASLLEQVGIPAAVVPVEGHVFLMFDSGVLEANRASFKVPDELVVARGGSLWVPVEVTWLGRPGASFEKAWSAGAEAYQSRYRPRPDAVVVVREAWSATPPATFPAGEPLPLGKEVFTAGAAEVASLLEGYRQAVLGQAGGGSDPEALLARGRLLAKNGFFEEAEVALQKAGQGKESFEAAYGLGVVRAGGKKTREAISSFEKASQLAESKQQQFLAAMALATTYRSAGDLDRARSACDQALTYNPAARFDSNYASLIRFLRTSEKTKAAGEEGIPLPYLQQLLAGM